MTRETRIGLLVGLMFIIAFGLILSELTGAGSNNPLRTAEAPRQAPDQRRPSADTPPPPARRQLAGAPRRNGGARSETDRRPAEAALRRGSRVEELDLEQLGRRFPPDPPARREPQRRQVRYYVVQPGDNLTKIARKTLRDSSRAAVLRIYNANRDKLTSPDNVPVGVKLVIPR